MRIALWEPFALTETLLRKHLKKSAEARGILIEKVRSGQHYDLVLFEGNYFPEKPFCSADLWLTPASCIARKLPSGSFLTGGMGSEDDVSLSSIGEDSALICIQREIPGRTGSLFPLEQKIPYDRNYTLYKNLAAGFGILWTKFLFGEEL